MAAQPGHRPEQGGVSQRDEPHAGPRRLLHRPQDQRAQEPHRGERLHRHHPRRAGRRGRDARQGALLLAARQAWRLGLPGTAPGAMGPVQDRVPRGHAHPDPSPARLDRDQHLGIHSSRGWIRMCVLDWTEINIWEYIRAENIPIIDLYFDKGEGTRYRSLGCAPCTFPIKSTAKTIDEIIEELRNTNVAERAGRAQDEGRGMELLRKDGYM